jgi:hypothetical protein
MKNFLFVVIGILLIDLGLNTDAFGNGILGNAIGAIINPSAMNKSQ